MTTYGRWRSRGTCFLTICFLANLVPALAADTITIDWGGHIGNCLDYPASFYGSEEAIRIAETLLLYQRASGGWPKGYDRVRIFSEDEKRRIAAQKPRRNATFDNGATHSEIRYLAKIHHATGDPRYRQAIMRGVEFSLATQYPNGGWPQFNPDLVGDARRIVNHITFNDDAMIGVMTMLDEIVRDEALHPYVDAQLRGRCADAIARGVACILRCQIEVDGKKTAWCAQHDEETLAPRKARTYELVSLSGHESVGVTKFLMGLDNPTPEVVEAIQGAVAWFDEAKLTGIRQIKRPAPASPKGWNKVIVEDVGAPPMWARFYTIDTNRPIFCSRDGVPRSSIAEISYERRNGYSWLGYYATDLLEKDYPAWQKRWAAEDNVLR